jgi:hypothetical protein
MKEGLMLDTSEATATYNAKAYEHESLENEILHDNSHPVCARDTLRNTPKQEWKLTACD